MDIDICKYCGKKEYYDFFTWLDGKCLCRSCYKEYFKKLYKIIYKWSDKDYLPEEIKELER